MHASKLWLPMVSTRSKLFPWCPQRLPDLTPSTAAVELKMLEAAGVADEMATRFLDDDKGKAAVRQMKLDCFAVHVP